MWMDDDGVAWTMTKGGHAVAVSFDEDGRYFFVDSAGDLFYDTGDEDVGFYVVDREDKVYNMFVDKEGNPQNVYVGRMDELKDFDIKTLGGIPVEELKKASDGRFNGTVTAFEDPNDDKVALPPNAPLELDEGGDAIPPPEIEEGVITLEDRKRIWPFGKPKDGGGEFQPGKG